LKNYEVVANADEGSLVGILEFYADIVGFGMRLFIVFQSDIFDKETVLETDEGKRRGFEPFRVGVGPGENYVDADFVLVESPVTSSW
jgi:hypothetical protein